MQVLKKAIKATVRKLQIELLPSPSFSEVFDCKFNKRIKPGFTTKYVTRYKTKLKSMNDSVVAAYHIWNNMESKAKKIKKAVKKEKVHVVSTLVDLMIAKPIPSTNIYDIGGKRDIIFIYEDDKLASSRAVHMPEFHNEIVMAPCDYFNN
jgi:hypothetical protein